MDDPKFKTRLCRFDQNGACRNGKDCPYAHGPGELRDPAREIMKKTISSQQDTIENQLNTILAGGEEHTQLLTIVRDQQRSISQLSASISQLSASISQLSASMSRPGSVFAENGLPRPLRYNRRVEDLDDGQENSTPEHPFGQ